MKKVVVFLFSLLIVVLAGTTFIEEYRGSEFVRHFVYASPWFIAIWSVLAFASIVVLAKRVIKRLPDLLCHIAFLVIFVGALLTFFTGQRGYIYLQQGVEEDSFIDDFHDKLQYMPFSIRLDTFMIDYYQGSNAPMNYSSHVTINREGVEKTEVVSMNKILVVEGYRLYQSSYDNNSSLLTVNHDPWGISTTYTGFILLIISLLWLMLDRDGEFSTLLKHPLLKKGLICVSLLLLMPFVNGQDKNVNEGKTPVISRSLADSLRTKQVIYNNRVVPYNTLARDIMQKLSGKTYFLEMSAEQIISSIILYPSEWSTVPLLEVKNKELKSRLGIDSRYLAVSNLFDGDTYKLEQYWSAANEGNRQNAFEKAVVQLDEKVGIFMMLQNGDYVKPVSPEDNETLLSTSEVKAEIIYNTIPFSKILFMFNLTVGFLSFFWFFISLIKSTTIDKSVYSFMNGLFLISFLFHTTGLGLRCYIAGHLPLSNGYETMQFLAWSIMLLALIFRNRLSIIVPSGFLLSGFTLLVSYLGQSNPQITPLMPVLLSPWLSIHVSIIMMSYALFAFMLLTGIMAVVINSGKSVNKSVQVEHLTLINRLFLYPAVFLLGTGIIFGAVWANVSWGRYWGWDPKEVWALITFLIYCAPFHKELMPAFKRPLFFNGYLIFASLSVIMTYFGVNWFLGGMHGY